MQTTSDSEQTKLPYKLGSPQDPHFPPSPRASEDLSRTEATAKWYDETFFRPEEHEELMDELINERGDAIRDEGRSWGEGESYAERNA